MCIKRLKRNGLSYTLDKLNELEQKFPRNSDYYNQLAKGLIKLSNRGVC